MSMYVYEDEARTKKLLAKDTTERNSGVRYYCPNSRCNARMFIWNIDGENKSFFRASGNPGHVEHCPYGSDNTYNPANTKEDGFDSDVAISNLMLPVGAKKVTEINHKKKEEEIVESDKEVIPHTLNQIYYMCKAHYCKDTFNGQTIGQILVDDRSVYMYPKGIFGYRIIEAKCRDYLYDDKNIYLETPIDGVKYYIKLAFKDAELFREIKNLIYGNRNHVIAVAGKWESAERYDYFVTEFLSKRQIKILKQEV